MRRKAAARGSPERPQHECSIEADAIREALRQLEDERLVTTARNRWTKVAPLDLNEPSRLMPITSALETLALRSGWPLSEDVVAKMGSANADLAKAVERRRTKDALAADLAFHGALDEPSDNEDLIAMLGRLRDRMRRVELAYWARPGPARNSVAEHEHILAAIHATTSRPRSRRSSSTGTTSASSGSTSQPRKQRRARCACLQTVNG